MADRGENAVDLSRLRKAAEEILEKKKIGRTDADEADLEHLLYELEVNRVELEIQNEELRHSAKELEAARNEYYDLFDAAPVGFVIIDGNGIIDRCNKAASLILTDSRAPMGGRLFSSRVHRDDHGVFASYLRTLFEKKKSAPKELRIVSKDGVVRYVHLEASAVNDLDGNFIHWRLALIDISERKKYENTLKKAHDEMEDLVRQRTAELETRAFQLARLTGELTLAEHRERKRLSELLHDDIQQLLTGARLHLENLAGKRDLENHPSYRSAHNLLTESIQTSRSLSSELSPPVLFQQGLAEALRWLARWMGEVYTLDVYLNIEENLPILQEELRILLFQSVRELLFNVVKHAETDSARVDLQHQQGYVLIMVSDAGAGFEQAALQHGRVQEKFGLLAIRERVELLGGRLKVESTPGSGSSIKLTAPFKPSVYARKQEAESTMDETTLSGKNPEPEPQPESNGKIRILLVDDHAVMRDGLSSLLSSHPDVEIVGEAANGEEAVDMARRIRPSVILMDISMPGMGGVEATRRIHAEMPEIRILGLSMHDAEDHAAALKQAGAEGYLEKSGCTDTLLAAVRGEVITDL